MEYEYRRDSRIEIFRTMKRTAVLSLIVFSTICFLSGSSGAQQQPAKDQRLPAEKKILIVYLSRTNNTKAIAEIIQQKVGGKLVALELETPYPADYNTTVQQVVHENETGYLPPLRTKIDRIEQYNVLFLGFPTWGMQLPPPVRSFLHQYDLKGKTVIPFNAMEDMALVAVFKPFGSYARKARSCKVSLSGAARKGMGNIWSSRMRRQKKQAKKWRELAKKIRNSEVSLAKGRQKNRRR
jgi:flavodoxin